MLINCTVTTPEKITQNLKGVSMLPVIFILVVFLIEILFYLSPNLKKESVWDKTDRYLMEDKYSRGSKNLRKNKDPYSVSMAMIICTAIIFALCIVLMVAPGLIGNYSYNALGGASGALIALAVISGLILVGSTIAYICTILDERTYLNSHMGVMTSSLMIMIASIWFSATSQKRLKDHFQIVKDYLYNKNSNNMLADWQLENLLEKATPEDFEKALYK